MNTYNLTVGGNYVSYGGYAISFSSSIPAKTIRFDFKYDHFDPTTLVDYGGIGATWTHVEADVYDFYYNDANWGYRHWGQIGASGGLFDTYAYYSGSTTVLPLSEHKYDIIDMNLDGVTNVSSLTTPAWQVQNIFSIRNSGSVTSFTYFLGNQYHNLAYTSIPLFDTSSAIYVRGMLENAKYVETGALTLYQQMSTQATPPTLTTDCFKNCGVFTTTGAAELAQIPTSWGGTMS